MLYSFLRIQARALRRSSCCVRQIGVWASEACDVSGRHVFRPCGRRQFAACSQLAEVASPWSVKICPSKYPPVLLFWDGHAAKARFRAIFWTNGRTRLRVSGHYGLERDILGVRSAAEWPSNVTCPRPYVGLMNPSSVPWTLASARFSLAPPWVGTIPDFLSLFFPLAYLSCVF